MTKLRKAPGTPARLGIYELSGPLDGVSFGNRVVHQLRVRNVSGATEAALAALRELSELHQLEFERVCDLDLAPLAGLPVDTMVLRDVSDVDLAPLANLPHLQALSLADVTECRVPDRLALPPSLEHLSVVIDAPSLTGAIVRDLVEAVDWARLTQLRAHAEPLRRRSTCQLQATITEWL
jgi:hypothetical protein